ncbi:MAG: hypothetical protein JJT82_06500 [Legionellaceae bacterium]|nr:hypothetical protein [Legionellaceae bacterium]
MNVIERDKAEVGRWWSQEVVLVANILPAVTGFVISLLAVVQLGIADFGKWMVWRSVCQLTANINPGFSMLLILCLPECSRSSLRAISMVKASQFFTIVWAVFSGLTFTLVLLFQLKVRSWDLAALVLYWSGIVCIGFTGCLSRGLQDGKALFSGTVGSTLGAFATVLTLIYSPVWCYFVLSSAVALWLQGVGQYIYTHPKGYSKILNYNYLRYYIRLSIHLGFPLILRGWAQTASQYSDRIVIGFFFGTVAAGAAGLGSTLALPLVMVSSAVAAWAVPVMISGKVSSDIINQYIIILIVASIGGLLILPVLKILLNKDVYASNSIFQLIGMSYYVTASIGLANLFLLPMLVSKKLWQVTIIQLIFVLTLWMSVLLGKFLVASLFWGLCVSACLLTYILILIIIKQKIKTRFNPYFGMFIPCFSSFYCYYLDVLSSAVLFSWAMAVVGFILGVSAILRFFKVSKFEYITA